MKRLWIMAALAMVPMGLAAQRALPAGTILPISINQGINAEKARPGQEICGVVMQNIPGTSIHRGAKILGHIVESTAIRNGPKRLEIKFDAVETHGLRIPLKAGLRALASYTEVASAQIPEDSPDSGVVPEDATTQQIGGDQVYRGGGPVAVGTQTVGRPTPHGVLALPRVQQGKACRGALEGNDRPQALWLFSTDACGVYGYSNIHIEHAGRTDPQGAIILSAKKGKLNINSGSGLLLRVQGA